MRQGQQNRRGRGRGGRKPQNPLARNYESNGPDVKIRGTAAHIAEKYMSLARDALASGDMVTAESYLQHAEHYNRIIMAAQQQFSGQPGAQQSEGPNGGSMRNPRWSSDDEGDDYVAEAGGGADIRAGGGQDRERHAGNREHHPGREGGGRDMRRHGGNGREDGREQNGADQPDAAVSDETSSDQVS
ncbi:MAG TPA: DUF4167 domain-containing protein [Methyloceanibacter sp.]|nr:DUF4167 domain-containing protein [Methyloceanibacter sp.]